MAGLMWVGAFPADLDLPLVPWEGGPSYYTVAQEGDKMTKAEDAGWSEDTFFPICVFLGSPQDAPDYAAAGMNTYMASDVATLSDITDEGMFLIANFTVTTPAGNTDTGWPLATIGSNPNVVAWFIYDEAEQGEGVYWDIDVDGVESTQFRRLEFFQEQTQDMRDLDDGRFMFANFGNGVLNTFWAPDTMADFVQTVDGCCVDKYAYTSPGVRFEMGRSDDWAAECGETVSTPACEDAANSSSGYGWFVKQMRNVFDDPANRRPQWVFVEVKKPFLGEADGEIILNAEREGAIWSAIANEARGIAYFDHNGFYPPNVPATDPNTGSAPTTETKAIIDGPATYATSVTDVNTKVLELAPVLNTQSYVWDFGATGAATMLKAKDGFAYIFASVDASRVTGSKTFTLTGTGITGTTVTVLYESRTIDVTAGEFDDTFSNEYSHHIYRIPI
jgi:hypothetical protein